MPRTAASYTQADIARAIRAAKAAGWRVRLAGGEIIIEEATDKDSLQVAAQPTQPAPAPCQRAPLVF
jgi:hypothetical protein